MWREKAFDNVAVNPIQAQNGGDCDVCHRPNVEPKSVIRFWSGNHEFYVCRSCAIAALTLLD